MSAEPASIPTGGRMSELPDHAIACTLKAAHTPLIFTGCERPETRLTSMDESARNHSGGLLKRFSSRLLMVLLLLLSGSVSEAKDKPRVGLRMELMSIRNRSSGPLPVRVKLEYNLPQILEGDLQLLIYDALDDYSYEDLMARVTREGIVLAGRDYEFNMILPPLRTAVTQNWAIEAFFVTKDERIALSSIQDRPDPPEAHDLLTTSPLERGMLLCSCAADPITTAATANRKFLESALSLDNYNPIYNRIESRQARQGSEEYSSGMAQADKIGRTIIHYAGHWSARDLPLDPLSYCAFDAVLLSDGALGKLSNDQMTSLTKWVRAGGSVCIVPDSPLKPQHLNFLRTLLEKGTTAPADLALSEDGTLLVVSDDNDPILMSHYGLGRAILLPAVEDLETRLTKEDLGSVVAFLWKVRRSQPVWNGELWGPRSLLSHLQEQGIPAQKDERGTWVSSDVFERHFPYSSPRAVVNGRHYLPDDFSHYDSDDHLSPKTEPLLAMAEQVLLPVDSKMVPVWVIGVILMGYVLTIGPIDYIVLGWLRMRKYTWVLFPIVTLLFTFATIAIANSYMGSDNTSGRLTITDLVDNGEAARQTVLETLFYGANGEYKASQKSQLIVQAEDSFTNVGWSRMNEPQRVVQPDAPLSYMGNFPQSYTVTQSVQQWSPVTLRSLTLEPEGVKPPDIDWNDPLLVTTPEGNHRLRARLAELTGWTGQYHTAMVLNASQQIPVAGMDQYLAENLRIDPQYILSQQRTSPNLVADSLAYMIPTQRPQDGTLFQVVSQVAPEGAGSLEDLAFIDSSDPTQWALVVIRISGRDIEVFRKLYHVTE